MFYDMKSKNLAFEYLNIWKFFERNQKVYEQKFLSTLANPNHDKMIVVDYLILNLVNKGCRKQSSFTSSEK